MAEVKFADETFRTADAVPLMALLRLARIAKTGTDADSIEGLSALYDMLEQLIHADDWERFQDAAMRTRADGEALMVFLADCYAAIKKTEAEPAKAEPEPEPAPVGMWI